MTKKERGFIEFVLAWHKRHGRHNLPWRETTDPYRILVSELMLQQTQVVRVIPKYQAFIKKFPTVQLLAKAQLGDVLRLWQGLGYNRRAKYLHECARVIVHTQAGQFPQDAASLQQLPGIGPYTAAAVCAFAYNQPVTLIETNVRQVFIHHFFPRRETVTDKEILEKVQRTIPPEQARIWYAALMDYGSFLKQQHGNNTQKATSYTKQTTFSGSDRQIRGAILRLLITGTQTKRQLQQSLSQFAESRVGQQLVALQNDGLIARDRQGYRLP